MTENERKLLLHVAYLVDRLWSDVVGEEGLLNARDIDALRAYIEDVEEDAHDD